MKVDRIVQDELTIFDLESSDIRPLQIGVHNSKFSFSGPYDDLKMLPAKVRMMNRWLRKNDASLENGDYIFRSYVILGIRIRTFVHKK